MTMERDNKIIDVYKLSQNMNWLVGYALAW